MRRIASATFARRAQLRRDVGPAAVVEKRLQLVNGEHVGHRRDARAEPVEVGDLVATPRGRMQPRELAEAVPGGVERVGRVRAEEAAAVRDDVVHDDDRLLRRVVDRCVVGPRRADVEPRRELAVETSLRQDVGAGRPVEVRLHAIRAGVPHPVRALDRHPEPDLLRERLRGVDLLDPDDAVTVVDVVERLAEPRRVEHRVERRRNGSLHGSERYNCDARSRLVVGRVR